MKQDYRETQTTATGRTRRRGLSVADWRALVRSNRNISGETRALLVDLSHEMRGQRTFSVSQRLMADAYGVSQRTIRGRIEEAHAAGLLVTVVRGRPGTTAVYQGTEPDPGTKRAPRKPPAYAGRPAQGTPETGPEHVLEGPHKQTGQHVREGVPPTREHGETSVDVRESPSGDVKPCTATTASGRSDGESVNHAPGTDTPTRQRRSGETPKGQLLDEIQRCAADDGRVSLVLAELLDAAEPGLGEWAAWQWTLPPAAAGRYEAGKQLLMMTNTFRVPVSA